MKNYYRELYKVQRQMRDIDIVTITAFMSDEQKMSHLEYYADEVGYEISLG